MRTHMLGAIAPSRGWCNRFVRSLKTTTAAAAERHERGTAAVMAYFPTWKGGLRMERLHRYSHLDMAFLLEADPTVTRWTADTRAEHLEHDDGEIRPVHHTFRVDTWNGVRLITLRDKTRSRQKSKRDRAPPIDGPDLRCETYSSDDLLADRRLQTSKDILFHRPRPWPRELPHRIATMAAIERPATLGDLHRRLSAPDVAFEDVISLVAQGFVDVDLNHQLGTDMPVVACRAVGHLG